MKTRIFLLLICLEVVSFSTVVGQTFFEDTKGKASIFLPIGGNVRINTSDKSLKFAYFYNNSDKDIVFGIDAKGKSNNGFAPIISNEKLSPEANVNFNLGFKNITTDDLNPSGYDYLNIKFGIGAAKYKILNQDTTYYNQINTESFNEISIGLSYNYYLNGNMIFGLYGGYEKTNNIESLSKLKILENTALGTDSLGTTNRLYEKEYTVWKGDFKPIDQFSFYFDYVFIPDFLDNRVACSFYTRSSFNSTRNQTNSGFGIYLNKKDEPLKVIGGVIYEFQDIFDSKETDTSLGKRGTLGIVLGYHF